MGRYISKEDVQIALTRHILEKSKEGIEPRSSGVERNRGRFIGYASFADGSRCTVEVKKDGPVVTYGRVSERPSSPIRIGFDTPGFFTASNIYTTIRDGQDPIGEFINEGRIPQNRRRSQ